MTVMKARDKSTHTKRDEYLMRGHVFLSTSSLLRSRQTADLAYFGALPEHFYRRLKRRRPTNLVDVKGEGRYSEDLEPCQTMDAEGERGQRDMPEPCHTMVTLGMHFPDLLELILRLRCHTVTLPTYDTCMYF